MFPCSMLSTKLSTNSSVKMRNFSTAANKNFGEGKSSSRIRLYTQNIHTGIRSNFMDKSYCERSAHLIHFVISEYFWIYDKWDRELLKAVFKDREYNWIEFSKRQNPNTICGIIAHGDSSILYNKEEKEEVKAKLEFNNTDQKVSLIIKNLFHGSKRYILTSDQIRESNDPVAISFFNCSSINSLTICSRNMCESRTLKKIEDDTTNSWGIFGKG